MSTPPSTEKFVCGCAFTYCYHFDVDQVSGIREAKNDAGPTLEEVKTRLAELSSTLEKNLKDVNDFMGAEGDGGDYYFDAGFTAGLRVALNELAKLSESL